MAFDAGSVQATLELDRTPFQQGLDQARADADRFSRDPINARLGVDTARADEELTKWRREQSDRSVGVQVKADADEASAVRAGEQVGRTASASAESATSAGMSGMAVAITAGIAAAAPFAGAAIVGAVGVGVVAAAALVERSNEQVKQSYTQLGHDVVTELRNASDQVVPYLTGAAHALDAEMQHLGPSISQAMSYAGPDIVALTGGLDRLAENAMPGVVSAMRDSYPVMSGLENLMADVGSSVGSTLQSMSGHSSEFGAALTSLGPIVASVLGLATNLVDDLASAWADNAAPIDSAIAGVTDSLSGLAGGVLPVLSTALAATTGDLQVVADVVTPIAPLLGTVGGAALTLWAALKLGNATVSGLLPAFNAVSASAVEYGNKLSALAGGSDQAVNSFKVMTAAQKEKAVADAEATLSAARQAAAQADANAVAMEAAAASEASAVTEVQATAARTAATEATAAEAAAMEGLAAAQTAVELSMGPLGLALVAGAAIIGLFAASQDKAKQSGEQWKQTTDNLTSAFEMSHGAVNQQVLQTLQADAGYKAASESAGRFGVSQQQLTQAVVAGGAPLDDLRTHLQQVITEHTHYATVTEASSKAAQELGRTAGETRVSIDSQGQAAQSALDQVNNLVNAYKQGQISGAQLNSSLQAVANTLVQTTEYQGAASTSAHMFGMSVDDVSAAYQNMIATGAATSTSLGDVTEAFNKAALAAAQANQAIIDHFEQADKAVVQATQSVADANHSYEQSLRSVEDAQHSYVQSQQAVIQAEQGVADAQHGVAQAQQQLQDAYTGVTTAEQSYTRAQEQEYTAQVNLNQAREQAIRDLETLHLQLADQVASEESARVSLFDATTAAATLGVNSSNAHAIAAQDVTAANEAQIKAALNLIKAQNSLNDTLNTGATLRQKVSDADRAGVEGAQVVVNAERALQSAQDQVNSSAQALAKAHEQVTAAEYALEQANRNLVRAQQAVESAAYAEQKAHQGVTDAEYARQHAALQLQQAQQALTDAQDADSRSLDGNSKASLGNLNMLYQLWDAIDKTGVPVQQKYREMVDDVATSFGISRDKAEEYLKQLGLIPKDFRYDVTAVAHVDTGPLSQVLDSLLGPGPGNAGDLNAVVSRLGRADGGPIDGPGGPKDDIIPIWASAGEYMQPADSVAYYGHGFMEAIRTKKLPRGGDGAAMPGFADGGLVANNVGLAAAGANYENNVNALQVMGFPHPLPLPVYVPPALPSFTGGAGVSQWAPQILQALAMLGQSPAWLGTVERRMNQESGGNPTVVNTWDSNWFAGTPSVGLMQVIGPTFAANAGPFGGVGPYEYGVSVDPLANIYAGLHYAIGRYGSLDALNQPGGYDNGGDLMPGYTLTYNGTGKPENVRTAEAEDALVSRLDRIERALTTGSGVTVQQTFHGNDWSAEEVAAATSRHMTAALRELTS